MNNIFENKNNFRNIIIKSIAVVFITNTILIYLYSSFFLNRNVSFSVNKTKNEINKVLDKIPNNITIKELKNIENKEKIEIQIKDLNNKSIYNSLEESNFQYINGKFIVLDGSKVFLMVSKRLDITANLLITQMLYIELGILLIITIFGYKLLSKKLLKPISNLIKDMSAYVDGVIPTKREKNTIIDELQNNFIDLTESVEHEKEKQNQIIACITHDIKTPLTSIMGYSVMLKKNDLEDSIKNKYINKINKNCLNLKEIISEFDDYLGCNLNQTVKFEKISIKEFINLIKEEYEFELKEKNIKLRIKNKCQNLDYLVLDINKMKRVFQNIIGNSTRYLKKTKNVIVITIEKKDNFYCIEIADNGIKVDEDIINKIFDPLFTTDKSRKISGLGLSICKQIIKLHSGVIFAKNNRMKGFSIFFTIKSDC